MPPEASEPTESFVSKYPLQITAVAFFVCACLAGFAISMQRVKGPIIIPSAYPPTISMASDSLTAQAAIVYDPTDGRMLYGKNEEQQLPLASITKLMTATAALADLPQNTPITLTSYDLQTEGDSGLSAGETWNLGDLVKYGLLVSSNDAMAAVATSVGDEKMIADMNEQAKNLGLAQSYFLDPTGLDLTPGVSGAYSSAHDVALLTAAFLKNHPGFFQTTVHPGATPAPSKTSAKPTATPLFDIPGLIGAKTGYTDLAGGNLVAAFDLEPGHPLIAVVLHSTQDGRFSDIRALIEAARNASTTDK